MRVAPLLERAQYHLQLAPGWGELVAVARPLARLLVRLAGQDAVLDQRGQPLGQHVGRDAQGVTELGEVLADETSRLVQQGLAGGVAALYPQFA